MQRLGTPILCALMLCIMLALPTPALAATTAPTLKVGVVYSSVALNCANYSGYVLGGANYTTRCYSTLDALVGDFPDAALIGDSVLNDLKQLRLYDVIVAPRLLALTSVQRNNIRAYVAEGGGFVGSFGVSRWDYVPARTPHRYEPLITLWQFSDSWDKSRAWEWGELSELYQVKFANDPLTYGGYTIAGQPANVHPILSKTLARPEVTTLNMVAKADDYNEIVWTMKGNNNVTPLYTYANSRTNDAAYPANGTLAGWTAPYYFGKVVYFGFQLHDMARSSYYADATSMSTARGILIESVRWAGTRQTYAPPSKTPVLSARGWFTRGKLCVDETVTNAGEAQLRGYLRVRMYNPANTLVYSGTAKNQQIPLPAGGSYTLTSWQPSIGTTHARGVWKVVCTYEHYDWLKGGIVTTSRTLQMQSNGTAMTSLGMGPQTTSTGNQPVTGEQIAGADRYATAVAISKRGWPRGIGSTGVAILATAANYPDALAAAPLAGKHDAPILLANSKTVVPAVSNELLRLYAGRASATLYVVGGSGALPDSIIEAYKNILKRAGTTQVEVIRLAGVNRYDTARSIALEVGTPQQGIFADTVIIVSGANYPDALAMGPTSAKMQVPILPVPSGYVPSEIRDALETLGVKHCVIVGGTSVVSLTVESWLESAGYRVPGVANGTANVDTRLAGSSRYDTGLLAADYSADMAGFNDTYLYVATGRNWPDALAFAPLGGKSSNPLILLDGTDLAYSVRVAEYFVARRDRVPSLGFIGGDGAVTKYVRGKVRIALDQ